LGDVSALNAVFKPKIASGGARGIPSNIEVHLLEDIRDYIVY